MAATPGDFSATTLRNVRIRLDEMFDTSSMNRHLQRPTPIFNSLFGDQSVRFTPDVRLALQDGTHCEAVEAFFELSCDLSVQDCETDCVIPEGPESCVDTVLFEPDGCVEKVFTVKDQECANEIDFQARMATATATILAALDQEGEKRTISQLDAWAEDLTDVELPTGGADATNTIWEIPYSELTDPQIFIDIACLIEDCEMVNAKIIKGQLWRKEMMLADAREGNGCCHYDGLLGSIPTAENTRELDKLLGGKFFFLVDNSKLGYYNRWKHNSIQPVNTLDQHNTHHFYIDSRQRRYTINGVSTPVRYDFYWQKICVSEDIYEYRLKGKERWGYVCLPDGCPGEPNKKVIKAQATGCVNC